LDCAFLADYTNVVMTECCACLSSVCLVTHVLWLNGAVLSKNYPKKKKQMRNGLWGIEWWCDRWRHVTLKGKVVVTPIC